MVKGKAKDSNFVSVRLPSDVGDWLRDYATANNLTRQWDGETTHNMGGSIIAIIRSVMQGQTISNNVGHIDNVDIEAMIDSKIAALRDSINLEFVDIKNELAAIATSTKEATAPANFTQALLQRAKEVAPLMLQKAS